MERITSAQNAKVKRVKELLAQAKARRKAGEFICEGERLCAEVPPELIREVWMSQSFSAQQDLSGIIPGADERTSPDLAEAPKRFVVPDSLFRSMGDTATPQGILTVCRMPEQAALPGLREPSSSPETDEPAGSVAPDEKILMLEGLQDPGNLGTIFRTAEAAGISRIILDRNCVDVFSPKVVRATMGSVFRVPFAVCEDLPALAGRLSALGWKTFAACLGADTDYREADYSGACAVLIGNEGNGLTDAAVAAATGRVIIPMRGQIESLNAAVAAALLMYEATRM